MDVSKTISIGVKAEGIKSAATSLDKLKTSAEGLINPIKLAQVALNSLKVDVSKPIEQIRLLADATKDAKTSLSGIATLSNNFKGLSGGLTSIASASERIVASVGGMASYSAELEKIRLSLTGMQGLSVPSANQVIRSTRITQDTPASPSSAGAGSGLATEQKRLLSQLEREAFLVNHTKAEWLEYRAAQKGVADQAAPYIQQLKNMQVQAGDTAISQKQLAFATRMIPAQLSDIAVQLAGGQNPMLVLMQQGAQLKDMLGGSLPAALAGVGRYLLSLLANPLVLLAAAIGTLTFAWYKGSEEARAFGKALAETNGYIGLSKSQAIELASSLNSVGVNYSKASEALVGLASAGYVANDGTKELVMTMVEFSRVTGESLEKESKLYASLQKDPIQALKAFDASTHAVTASTLLHVDSLIKQGDTLGATRVAIEAVRAAQAGMAEDTINNMAPLGRFFKWYLDTALDVYSNMKKLFADDSYEIQIIKSQERLNRLKAASTSGSLNNYWSPTTGLYKQIKDEEDNLKKLKSKRDLETKTTTDKKKTNEFDTYWKRVDEENSKAQGKETRKLATLNEQKKIESEILALQRDKTKMSEKDYNIRLTALKARKSDAAKSLEDGPSKPEPSGTSALASARAELDKQNEINRGLVTQGANYEKITEDQKKLLTIQETIKMSGERGNKVKASELALAKQLLPIYLKIVEKEKENTKLQEENKQIDNLKKSAEAGRELAASLEDQIAFLKESGSVQDTRTEAEKKIAKLQADANLAKSQSVQLAAKEAVEIWKTVSADERKLKATLETNKAHVETVKKATDYKLEVEAAQQAQQNALAWQHLSTVEQEKRSELQAIEVARLKEVAELEDKIIAAKKENNTDLAEEYKKQQTLANQKASGLSDVVRSKPTLSSKEGTGVFSDWEAASVNFWNSLESRASMMQQVWSSTFQTMGSSLQTFTETGKLDFKSFTVSILKNINQMLVQFLMLQLAQKAVGLVVGSMSGSTGSNPSAGAGVGDYSSLGMWSGSGVTASGSAKGNVFNSGSSLSGGVYTSVTPFRFAKGASFGSNLGVMGEAGPEAVMPLARGADGKLGVKSSGSGENNVSVVVNVTDSGNSTKTSGDAGKGMNKLGDMIGAEVMKVLIREKRPNGILAN